jgi:hypothetical protein
MEASLRRGGFAETTALKSMAKQQWCSVSPSCHKDASKGEPTTAPNVRTLIMIVLETTLIKFVFDGSQSNDHNAQVTYQTGSRRWRIDETQQY